jgi:hypothetical protein
MKYAPSQPWVASFVAMTACSTSDAQLGGSDAKSANGGQADGGAPAATPEAAPAAPEAGSSPDASGTGDAETVDAAVPQETAVALSVGGWSACVITGRGGVVCGGTGIDATWLSVAGLVSGVTAISVGGSSACAITASGAVVCWGDNEFGQLGNTSTTAQSAVPLPVIGLSSGVTAISVGGSSACAVTGSGGVVCWGDNEFGQLGNASTMTQSAVPLPVAGLASGVTELSVGSHFACAVTGSGGVACWGANDSGLGANQTATAAGNAPMPVTGLENGVTAVSVGYTSACALGTNGAVVCWGSIAQGYVNVVPSIPLAVDGLVSGVTAVSVGDPTTLAWALQAGGVVSWGVDMFLENVPSYPPTPIVGLTSGVTAISVGASSACALTASGRVVCWQYDLELTPLPGFVGTPNP